MFALNIATGKHVWKKAGRCPIAIQPATRRPGYSDRLLSRQRWRASDSVIRFARLRMSSSKLRIARTALPGFIAGRQLLTGNEETLRVYDILSAEPIGEPLQWITPWMHGHASQHASVDDAVSRQFGLDRLGEPRNHAAAGSAPGLLGEQQPLPGERRAQHAESHGRLHLQLRARLDGLRAGWRCRAGGERIGGCSGMPVILADDLGCDTQPRV